MICNFRFSSISFLVLLSLLCYQSMVSAQTCPQGCYCIRNLLDCQNPSFPMRLPPGSIDHLSIRGVISRIPANAFIQPEGNSLKSLSINQVQITNVASNAFSNLVVDSVSFYLVRVQHFEPRIFANLTCNTLSIYSAAIDTIPTSFFEGLTTGSLNIYNNNITTVETNAFIGATVRSYASFYHNVVYTIQKNALQASFSMNVYLNKIKTFLKQESVVPKMFHSNKFQCSCSLGWMWKQDSTFKYFLGRNKCLLPEQQAIILEDMDESALCKRVDLSTTHTSKIWSRFTTKSHTRSVQPSEPSESSQSSRPTPKGTTRRENITRRPLVAADTEAGSRRITMNLVMSLVVSLVICSSSLF